MGDFVIVYNFYEEKIYKTPIDHLLHLFPPYTSTLMNVTE